MGDRKLTSPRLVIIRDGLPDLEVQTTNADMIQWDFTRAKQKPPWPSFQEAPVVWMTFLGWCAARRTGAIEPSYTWETWRAEVLEVVPQTDDDDSEEGAPFPIGEQSQADL